MASTSAITLESTEQQQQQLIIAPDDSDFLDSDADSKADSEDREIEAAVLADMPQTPTSKSPHKTSPSKTASDKLRPCHQLISIHRRFMFTWFPEASLPNEDRLNQRDGKEAAWLDLAAMKENDEPEPERFHWFNIDQDLVYLSFWSDWGPLNVGMFYRFCLHLHHLLTDEELSDRTMVLYTSDSPFQKANAALLAAMYSLTIGKKTPAQAFAPLARMEFRPFQDAGYGKPDYNLSIQDILYGVHRAINEGLLDLTTFNLDEYEKFEQVQNGDWNWITPQFIAFASPNHREYVEALRINDPKAFSGAGILPKSSSTFAQTIRNFKERGVKLVVRLNNPLYDSLAFREHQIDHVDMYFDDGSNPSEEILRNFIKRADEVISGGGVVAVHCKAGLGRTGVLIGAYLCWKYGFTAGEVIGFMRIMRPGCVVGPQQHFMYQNFVEWIKWGVYDNAMKEAQKVIDEERAKLAMDGEAGEQMSRRRTSLKRRADSDSSEDEEEGDESKTTTNSEDERPKQRQRKQDPSAAEPVTPKAQKGRIAPPMSAAPAVKPTPCVGQPRKSPSPSRKRPAIQAPATVARLELTGRTYPALSSSRSLRNHMAILGSGVELSSSISHANDVLVDHDVGAVVPSNNGKIQTEHKLHEYQKDQNDLIREPAASAVASGFGGVLVESKVNVVGSRTPNASPKAAVVALASSATPNLTPSPVARVRTTQSPYHPSHERSRSAVVCSHSAASVRTGVESSPKGAEMFRASPNVREKFGLRDTSQSPEPSAGSTVVEVEIAPAENGVPPLPPSPTKRSDAEVLGVIDCIPQNTIGMHGASPTARHFATTHSPVARVKLDAVAAVVPHSSPATADDARSRAPVLDENMQVVKAALTIPARNTSHANLASSAASNGPKVLRTTAGRAKTPTAASTAAMRAGTTTRIATTNGSATTTAATATSAVRRPIVARTNPSASLPQDAGATGSNSSKRSVSAKINTASSAPIATVRSSVLRAQKSTSSLRSRTPTAAATTTTTGATSNAARSVSTSSNTSTSSTSATVNGTSRVGASGVSSGSRLTAPTAASAARAAANKKSSSNLLSTNSSHPNTNRGVAAANALIRANNQSSNMTRSVSGLQRQPRRRRSSLGEIGVDVNA